MQFCSAWQAGLALPSIMHACAFSAPSIIRTFTSNHNLPMLAVHCRHKHGQPVAEGIEFMLPAPLRTQSGAGGSPSPLRTASNTQSQPPLNDNSGALEHAQSNASDGMAQYWQQQWQHRWAGPSDSGAGPRTPSSPGTAAQRQSRSSGRPSLFAEGQQQPLSDGVVRHGGGALLLQRPVGATAMTEPSITAKGIKRQKQYALEVSAPEPILTLHCSLDGPACSQCAL